MSEQMVLPLHLPEEACFEQFIQGPNAAIVAAIKALAIPQASPRLIYLAGPCASGRSHLLQALCRAATQASRRCAFLPLQEFIHYPPTILQGFERYDLLCLDDIDAIAGSAVWEERLFHLFNQVRAQGGDWLVSARQPVRALSINLADLHSRLSWGESYWLKPLSDENKIKVLQNKARQKGMELADEVGDYLLTRISRELADLLEVLAKLDRASLRDQRRLTIPFVRLVLQQMQ